jgi:hypothetical protein
VDSGGSAENLTKSLAVICDEDCGIFAEIARDSILCISADFGWDEKHVNDPPD